MSVREGLTILQAAFNWIDECISKIDLAISITKTEAFVTSISHGDPALNMNDQILEIVSNLKCCGSTILPNRKTADDVRRCTGLPPWLRNEMNRKPRPVWLVLQYGSNGLPCGSFIVFRLFLLWVCSVVWYQLEPKHGSDKILIGKLVMLCSVHGRIQSLRAFRTFY